LRELHIRLRQVEPAQKA